MSWATRELEVVGEWTEAVVSGDYATAIAVLERLLAKPPVRRNSFVRHIARLLQLTKVWQQGQLKAATRNRLKVAHHCSFCGGVETSERKLVAGPDVFICGKCIELCSAVFKSNRNKLGGPPPPIKP